MLFKCYFCYGSSLLLTANATVMSFLFVLVSVGEPGLLSWFKLSAFAIFHDHVIFISWFF